MKADNEAIKLLMKFYQTNSNEDWEEFLKRINNLPREEVREIIDQAINLHCSIRNTKIYNILTEKD